MTALTDALIAANEKYAASLTEAEKSLPLPPGKKYSIVTCMDARIHPASALGISLGDAHIIRNAGGSARDALRSLTISQQLLGTQEIILIKHTGCGMLTFTNEDLYRVVEKNLGAEAAGEAKKTDYLPFPELEDKVKEEVEWLKAQKLVTETAKEKISGWIYEVETGKVKRVV